MKLQSSGVKHAGRGWWVPDPRVTDREVCGVARYCREGDSNPILGQSELIETPATTDYARDCAALLMVPNAHHYTYNSGFIANA